MKKGIKIASVRGIEIGVDYSWFIVFFLVTWSLSAHYFPMRYGWGSRLSWTVGVITSLLFFGSVLAHELGHSLVAISKGIPVRSITLFIFGGISQISKEPERPLDEFLIASVGPVVSGALGVLFLTISALSGDRASPMSALTTWLGGINLMLAVFNVVPGFPLDGGRILRSIVWGVSGSYRKGTEVSSKAGRVVAYGLIIIGIWLAFSGQWVNGLWLAFIGWFLESAAESYYRQVALKDQLAGIRAVDVMTKDCPRLPAGLTLQTLVTDYLLKEGRRCFLVSENGGIAGIITLTDVKAIPRDRWPLTTVAQAMTPFGRVKAVRADAELFSVLEMMAADDVNQTPVVEGGQLLGMISRDQLLSLIAARAELGATA